MSTHGARTAAAAAASRRAWRGMASASAVTGQGQQLMASRPRSTYELTRALWKGRLRVMTLMTVRCG